jgi:flavin reductase (DIM6/NTAB) family NADH-FMN oxidoreductase RutF
VLRQVVGDHLLVVGEVIDAGIGPPRPPLLHHAGAFGAFRTSPGA